MKFKMTEKDRQEGVAGDAMNCPVARCMNREMPGKDGQYGQRWEVCGERINDLETGASYQAPDEVEDFVDEFDDEERLPELIEFDIDILPTADEVACV